MEGSWLRLPQLGRRLDRRGHVGKLHSPEGELRSGELRADENLQRSDIQVGAHGPKQLLFQQLGNLSSKWSSRIDQFCLGISFQHKLCCSLQGQHGLYWIVTNVDRCPLG